MGNGSSTVYSVVNDGGGLGMRLGLFQIAQEHDVQNTRTSADSVL